MSLGTVLLYLRSATTARAVAEPARQRRGLLRGATRLGCSTTPGGRRSEADDEGQTM